MMFYSIGCWKFVVLRMYKSFEVFTNPKVPLMNL